MSHWSCWALIWCAVATLLAPIVGRAIRRNNP